MNIAFYAPLKPPDHPIPSGDRQMARLLIKALELGGHETRVMSQLRAYLPDNTAASIAKLQAEADAAIGRIFRAWPDDWRPHLWLTYHPYYRAPDLLGVELSRRLGLPYVTVEASWAGKRDRDAWAPAQRPVIEAVRSAAMNICFTVRDRDGLATLADRDRLQLLAPFIDVEPHLVLPPRVRSSRLRLVAVAMMRKGDKFNSFRMLSAALRLLGDVDWQLTVIGNGPLRDEIKALFAEATAGRIDWVGELAPDQIPHQLAQADLYIWPGCGEAYGLAYLEAQAAGLAVVAQATAGVPEVVVHGRTGILTEPGNVRAFADAVRRLAVDRQELHRLGCEARAFVLGERTLQAAARRLGILLSRLPAQEMSKSDVT